MMIVIVSLAQGLFLQKDTPAGGTIGEHTHRTSTKLKVCTNYIVLTPLIGVLQ